MSNKKNKNVIVEQFKTIPWIRGQIIFSKEGKFIYMKPGKCAGTSIYRCAMQGGKKLNGSMHNYCKQARGGIGQKYDVLNYKDNPEEFEKWFITLTDEDILNYYFTFTFVRNPFDRIVSAYNHIVKQNLKKKWSFTEFIKNGLLNKDEILSNGKLFKNFPSDQHWIPQHFHAYYNDKCFLDYIGKVENIKEDWLFISNKLGYSKTLPKLRYGPKRDDYRNYYKDDETIEIVSEVYKKDLELFNYEF